MKIGIIIGSVRDGRQGTLVAEWIKGVADARPDADFEIVDLKDFDVPLLTTSQLPALADRQYDDPAVVRWGEAIDGYDGYIFVTPEYNHSIPGAFKNAFDSISPEWVGKTVGFVSYGVDGGVRAVEHWRAVVANSDMYDIRQQVSLGLFTEFGPEGLALEDRRAGELEALLGKLVSATERMRQPVSA